MAKASRSNKKQPAFDPSELEDLIFSPAVGKGVGSHLVGPADLSTIARSKLSTSVNPTTIAWFPLTTEDTDLVTTVVTSEPAPLGSSSQEAVSPTPDRPTTVDRSVLAPVVNADLATVVNPILSPVAAPSPPSPPRPAPIPGGHKLWITENGDLVAEARVRKIRLAQDVINSAEENVYDTLWNAKLLQTEEREGCRIVQAGYDYLVKRTRLARKTIQRIVAKLLEKDFIAIETRADIYQRSATVYRVYSYKSVLDRHIKKGRLYVAKMGPGFSYAQPLDQNLQVPAATADNVTTVDMLNVIPMVSNDMATVAKETTVTMVKIDRPTVVKMSPHLLDTSVLDKTSSSAVIHRELNQYAPADDDAAKQLLARCREIAPDCTEEEIVYFIRQKSSLLEKKKDTVYNPLGFLLTAVPRCFQPENLRSHRAESLRQQEGKAVDQSREQAAMDRWRREQEASLADPNLSAQEKHLIRLCLGLNTGATG